MSARACTASYEVIIAGAGPVGLCTAIDLGRKGVKCLVMERNSGPAPWPKMDRTNARSMEMLRRVGLADRVRELGYPADNPMDVFLMTRLSEPPLAVLKYPSVAECRRQIASSHDGSLPLEPYQLVSQNKVEPFLRAVAEASPYLTVRYGLEFVDLEQDGDGVTVTANAADGEEVFRCAYLVGCDGGASAVRKRLGVQLEGQGRIRDVRQVIFSSEDLYAKIPYGKGRHYSFIDEGRSLIVAQGDRKEFTLHTSMPADADFAPYIRELIGFPCDLKILHVLPWRHNLLLAERYRQDRVFLAGDAAHLVIPTGGLGFNSGLGDAFDLSWKLAAVLKGWGGAGLLDAYEIERRPVGAKNIEASGAAAAAVPIWQAMVTDQARAETAEGDALRFEIAQSYKQNHNKMHKMRGAEFGYTYAGSPILAEGEGEPEDWDIDTYTPHTRLGARIPHVWLRDGAPLQDVLGEWYTFLDLRGDVDSTDLEDAFRSIGAPLAVVRRNEPHARELFGASAFLLRPDLHIAWRGEAVPDSPSALARRITGNEARQDKKGSD